MELKGIQIFDKDATRVLAVRLPDILEAIFNGDSFHWSILFLDGVLLPKQEKTLSEYIDPINESKNGLGVSWESLLLLDRVFFQMYEVTILGSRDVNLLRRYEMDKEMHEKCDISIRLVDCAFWEIYSRDQDLIQRLKKKFTNIELLENW